MERETIEKKYKKRKPKKDKLFAIELLTTPWLMIWNILGPIQISSLGFDPSWLIVPLLATRLQGNWRVLDHSATPKPSACYQHYSLSKPQHHSTVANTRKKINTIPTKPATSLLVPKLETCTAPRLWLPVWGTSDETLFFNFLIMVAKGTVSHSLIYFYEIQNKSLHC